MRIRTRLTLIFTAIMAVVIAVAGVFLLLRLRSELVRTIDDALRSRADLIAGGASLPTASGSLIEKDEAFAQILGPGGTVEESSAGLTSRLLDVSSLRGLTRPRFFERDLEVAGERVPARLLAVKLSEDRVLVVGSSLEDQRDAVRILARLLAVGGPALAGMVAIMVWSVAGAALRPVEKLRQEADALSVSEIGRPLNLPRTDDEIRMLGSSLNRLLARLSDAFEKERRFIDTASHELRTPVSTLKAELELTLSGSTSEEQMRQALERALADADYLALLTDDLLVLARADEGRLPIRRQEVDLGGLVEQCVAGFTQRAESSGIAIRVDARGTHFLDPLRLRQVLNNLIDNALRSVPPGGSVTVRTSLEDSTLLLEVEDTGPGFPADTLAALIDDREDAGGEWRGPGGGLGLRIVKTIAKAHGGTLEIENVSPVGARIRLRFPAEP